MNKVYPSRITLFYPKCTLSPPGRNCFNYIPINFQLEIPREGYFQYFLGHFYIGWSKSTDSKYLLKISVWLKSSLGPGQKWSEVLKGEPQRVDLFQLFVLAYEGLLVLSSQVFDQQLIALYWFTLPYILIVQLFFLLQANALFSNLITHN